MCNDAAVVRDQVTFLTTFGFQPINGGAYNPANELLNYIFLACI